MSQLEIVRTVATEFADVTDEQINQWLEMTRHLVSAKRFGSSYDQAVALLSCHRLKMAGYGDTSTGGINNTLRVASYSEGETSVSYANQVSIPDGELMLTSYGLQFLTLRKMRIIPIISAGEA